MNNPFIFITAIVAIVMLARLVDTWLKQRKQKPSGDEDLAETLVRLEQLEERIRVLERIVTENRVDLKQQIDSL